MIRVANRKVIDNMTKKRFSKKFATYQEWSAQAPKTEYTKGIRRMHARYPKATLSQLRRHPRKGQIRIGQLRKRPLHQRPWRGLSAKEKDQRERSLKALSYMRRKDHSLTSASKMMGVSPKTVRRHTRAFRKERGRYRPKAYDRIERVMAINEGGREIYISVRDSRHASTIGRYQSAVGHFLHTGDASVLRPFKGKRVRDASGKMHTLETDPQALYEIAERREDEEFYSIYRR